MRMLSLDVETTGLDPAIHGIIQLGGVLFESTAPVGQSLKMVEIDLQFDGLVWDSFCLNLHKDWIAKNSTPEAKANLFLRERALDWFLVNVDCGGDDQLVITGKNPWFDIGFCRALPNTLFSRQRRIYLCDPANWFVHSSDAKMPSLPRCKERAMSEGCGVFQTADVKHTALADAWDAMILVQWAFNTGKVPKC